MLGTKAHRGLAHWAGQGDTHPLIGHDTKYTASSDAALAGDCGGDA